MEHKIAFEDLSPEIQEKLRNCKTKEELRELVTSLGAELSEEVLRAAEAAQPFMATIIEEMIKV